MGYALSLSEAITATTQVAAMISHARSPTQGARIAGDARTEVMPTMENSAERNERRNIFASTLSA